MQASGFRGGGYGLYIPKADKESHFDRAWTHVTIEFPDRPEITFNIRDTFWTTCPELRSAEVGRWLEHHNVAPWPKGKPPKIPLKHIAANRFAAELPTKAP